MQITDLTPPINGGTLYLGQAVSTRGRRYTFYATFSGEACGVFREDPAGRFWWQITPPLALKKVVRQGVRKARA